MMWGQNSSLVELLLGLLSSLVQCSGFDLPLGRIFSFKGGFSLGVNMGSDSIPPKLFWMKI